MWYNHRLNIFSKPPVNVNIESLATTPHYSSRSSPDTYFFSSLDQGSFVCLAKSRKISFCPACPTSPGPLPSGPIRIRAASALYLYSLLLLSVFRRRALVPPIYSLFVPLLRGRAARMTNCLRSPKNPRSLWLRAVFMAKKRDDLLLIAGVQRSAAQKLR